MDILQIAEWKPMFCNDSSTTASLVRHPPPSPAVLDRVESVQLANDVAVMQVGGDWEVKNIYLIKKELNKNIFKNCMKNM